MEIMWKFAPAYVRAHTHRSFPRTFTFGATAQVLGAKKKKGKIPPMSDFLVREKSGENRTKVKAD